ncbi:MAG TPA: LysR family transcriptional regulator [Sphingobium sp.]
MTIRRSASRIDLVSLRVLIAAIEEGNLTGAAEREHIAISSVSRRIADLEHRWGIQLLHRHDRGVKPTAAAESVLDRMRSLFDLLEQIVDDVVAVGAGERGLIRIKANMTAATGYLPAMLATFTAQHPGIDIEMEEETSAAIVHSVQVGTCDMGIVSDTLRAEGVHLLPWIDDELVVVVPKGHILSSRKQVGFADLLDFPFIGMQRLSALQGLYRSHAEAIGRSIKERAQVVSFEAARKLVANGLGVAILPRVSLQDYTDDAVMILALSEKWAMRRLTICFRDQVNASAATKLFIGHLQHNAATMGS